MEEIDFKIMFEKDKERQKKYQNNYQKEKNQPKKFLFFFLYDV